MNQKRFEGKDGEKRLKGMIAAIFNIRKGATGTQEYALGWITGLLEASAINEDAHYIAQQFIAEGGQMPEDQNSVLLYMYPDDVYSRVEGKAKIDLEREILDGGPHGESRVSKIYCLASDESHELHFVAKHFLFLSRASNASIKTN